ncbi:MAG: DNA adenine methylase [Bacteroidales bacterium]|nr:DNA adenine methylase [Alphaproteobacteria bacterium]MBR4677752.1 DNA adenine methylase [Bacteroidales bacterium]
MIQSPLNYTGGKFKLLPQILPLFPQNIDTFVDLFCGGGDVGTSVQSNKVLFNDINSNVIGILNTFKNLSQEDIFVAIKDIISHYSLSDVSTYGYSYYNCNSSKGVGSYNRESFKRLKDDFNNLQEKTDNYYLLLYVLIVFCFNNQIRFNKQGKFNLPIGKRDFNAKMQMKLSAFIERLHGINCEFSSKDFREVAIEGESTFVYADPPYLITCAAYNEQGGWSEDLERELHIYLDKLHTHNIRFALSNVLTSKGKTNVILQEWLIHNPQYICHHLNYNYSNSNYHTAGRESVSDEVLITNY